jgi:DNA polymerase I-like protein with 3'-5' exonuclease and polymerase domains
MNNPSPSLSTSAASAPPKVIQTNNEDPSQLVTINERVNLTKKQNEVLQMVCNSYEMTISEYMQQALVEAMRFDIEEGNFSDVLLEKLGLDTDKKKTDFTQSTTSEEELEKLLRQQTS